jgi:hypothetical protein
MPFRNPTALLGLLSIIPLILIYLIRPRPKEIRFSATLFLKEGEVKRSAVLSRLISDPLFWVQLLVLCSLSLAAAGPYTIEEATASSHLVVVLDSSASMQASSSRALQMIEPYLQGYERVSIVLAGILPQTALLEGSPNEARDVLKTFSPKAVSSDLSAGMTQGAGLLAREGGHMLVVSDFNSWTGDDPEDTRKILQADGRLSIVFADARQAGENVALTEAWDVPGPGYVNHTALLHNYGQARSVPITIRGPGGETSRILQLGAGEDYFLSTTAYPGINEISLDIDDAISWDNRAYVYLPEQGQKRILYLGEDGPALAALRSLPNTEVERAGQPEGYDLVVLSGNDSENGKLNQYLDGGRVIYIASGEREGPEYLPVRLEGVESGPASLWVRNEGFAKGLHFNEIGLFSYPKAAARKGSTTLVEANGQPILSYWRLGKGTVIYSGLELDSDFHLRPEYPIFWYQMVNWITDVPNTVQSNRKTGEMINLGEAAIIETPSTSFTASSLLLDQVGIYRYQGKTIAANMYDPKESSLQRIGAVEAGQFGEVSRQTTVEKDLSHWVIALAALAMLLELAVMRRRRET